MTSLNYQMPPVVRINQRSGAIYIEESFIPTNISVTHTFKGPVEFVITFAGTPVFDDAVRPVPAAPAAPLQPTHRAYRDASGHVVLTPVTEEEDVTEHDIDRMMAEARPVEIVTGRDIATLE